MIALALLILLSAIDPSMSPGAMFRGGAAHLGVYDSTAPSLRTVAWRFHAQAPFVSSPTVFGGVVYVGNNDGAIYAIRTADGKRLWRHPTGGPVTSTPAVWNGSVFVASEDGFVYALDAQSGGLRWRFQTQGERRFQARGIHGIEPANQLMADPFDMFISSPVVAGGVVYVGSGDHYVYALDAASGAMRWKFLTGDVVHATPAVAGGIVYVGSWDRYLYALDAATGKPRWRLETGDDQKTHNQIGIQGSAAVADGMVFFGCRDSHLYAVDASTGQPRWSHDEHGSWVIGTPAVYRGNVYSTTSDEHEFFALDARTGAEKFHVNYGVYSFSSPSVAAGVAYFGTFDGLLYAVDTASGKTVATFETDGAQHNRAAHLDAHGKFDLDGFYASNTLAGINEGLAKLFTLGSIVASPAIDDGTLYVGATDGTLYALR